MVGLCEDVVAGVPGSRDSAQEAASLRGEDPAVVAERLRAAVEQLRLLGAAPRRRRRLGRSPSGVPDLTMGEGILTLWYDTFVHADDIRVALGRPAGDGPGLRAAVAYLEAELSRRGWGPARVLFVDQGEGFGAVAAERRRRRLARPIGSRPGPSCWRPPVGSIPTAIGLDEAVNIYAA